VFRSTWLVALLFVTGACPVLLAAAPPRSASTQPPGINQLQWEIVALPKGGKGNVRVLQRLTGSEPQADARAAYLQMQNPNLYVYYRKAR
jgi:hypothetical protein